MIHSRSCCYTSHNTFNSFFLYAFRFHDFFLCVCAAPPSLPVCLWEGDTEAGGNVQLSCLVAEGFPTPQVIWEKLEPDKMTLPVNMNGKKKSFITEVQNTSGIQKQLFLPVSVAGDTTGSVHIANVSAQTSGLYRCSVTNPLGTQHCYINLSVYTRESLCTAGLK